MRDERGGQDRPGQEGEDQQRHVHAQAGRAPPAGLVEDSQREARRRPDEREDHQLPPLSPTSVTKYRIAAAAARPTSVVSARIMGDGTPPAVRQTIGYPEKAGSPSIEREFFCSMYALQRRIVVVREPGVALRPFADDLHQRHAEAARVGDPVDLDADDAREPRRRWARRRRRARPVRAGARCAAARRRRRT